MKENKDIHPIDDLFRQSLEWYSPPPPPGAWEKIRLQLGKNEKSPWQFITSNAGMFIVSAVIIGAAGWLVFNIYFSSTSLPDNRNSTSLPKSGIQGVNDINKTKSDSNTTASAINVLPGQAKNTGNPTISTSIALSKPTNPVLGKPATQPNQAKSQPVVNQENFKVIKNTASWDAKATNDKGLVANKRGNPASTGSGMDRVGKSKTDLPQIIATSSTADGLIPENRKNNLSEVSATQKTGDEKPPAPENGIQVERQVPTNANLATMDENPVPASAQAEVKNIDTSAKDAVTGEPNPDTPANQGVSQPPTTGNLAPAGNTNLPTKRFDYSMALTGSIGQVVASGLNPHEFYAVNLMAGITHNKLKAGIETGLGYSYYKDRGIFEFEYQKTDTTGYKGFSLFNAYDSSYLVIYKPVTSNRQINIDTNTKFSYSYIKIPLYFTKSLYHFGRIELGVKTGPACELMVSRKGVQPEHSLPGASFLSLKNNSPTMLKTNWQWLVAPQISWKISDNFSFLFEPAAIFYLNNLYEKKNKPSTKPYGIGVWTGILYRF